MVGDEPGEGQRFADEATAPLPQRAEESFDVDRQSRLFAARRVTVFRNDGPIGIPEVGADNGPVPILIRQRVPETLGRGFGSVARYHRHDLPGFGIQGHPHPPDFAFGTYKTPEFVRFEDEFARFFFNGPGSQGVWFW